MTAIRNIQLRSSYSFVACLSHLPIGHASLSRRSTVPTPNRNTSNNGAVITIFPCNTLNCLFILSPSYFTVCGHHLSPRIVIVFSLISSLRNSSMSHPSNSSSLTHRVPACIFHILLLCESYSLLLCWCATRTHMCIHVLLLPTTAICHSSFW